MNAVRSTLRASIRFLVGVLLLGGAVAQVQAQGPGKGVIPAAANVEQASFDRPLNWMYEAKTNYTAVKDYTCTLVSQEKVNGKMGELNVVTMKFMAPFSVHMRWQAPPKDKEQEVVFVQGKNNNKMRVKSNKLGGVAGFMSIDVTDPRVLQNSRHTILEAGIGNMIDQTIKSWEIERSLGKTRVLPPVNARYNERDCIKIEVVRLERTSQPYYRTVIYLEKVSKMPIHLENYAWPRESGPADGELMEEFSYHRIEWNKGLKEAQFNK